MSCHCLNRLRGVAGGANPSLVSGRVQGTPWISRQLIAGPSLVSNVGFSISFKDTSTCSSAGQRSLVQIPAPGFEPVTFRSLVDLTAVFQELHLDGHPTNLAHKL